MGFWDWLKGKKKEEEEVEQLREKTKGLSEKIGVLQGKLANAENRNIQFQKQIATMKTIKDVPKIIDKAEKKSQEKEISQIATTELMDKPCVTVEGFNIGYFKSFSVIEGPNPSMCILGSKTPRQKNTFEIMRGTRYSEMIRNHKYIKSAHCIMLARDIEGNHMPTALTPEEFARLERRCSDTESDNQNLSDSWMEVTEDNRQLKNLVNNLITLVVSKDQMGALQRNQVKDMIMKFVSTDADILTHYERAVKQSKINEAQKEHIDELLDKFGKDAKMISKDKMQIGVEFIKELLTLIGGEKSTLKFLKKFTTDSTPQIPQGPDAFSGPKPPGE